MAVLCTVVLLLRDCTSSFPCLRSSHKHLHSFHTSHSECLTEGTSIKCVTGGCDVAAKLPEEGDKGLADTAKQVSLLVGTYALKAFDFAKEKDAESGFTKDLTDKIKTSSSPPPCHVSLCLPEETAAQTIPRLRVC
eukprot:3269529-Rhodomonas_salina.2